MGPKLPPIRVIRRGVRAGSSDATPPTPAASPVAPPAPPSRRPLPELRSRRGGPVRAAECARCVGWAECRPFDAVEGDPVLLCAACAAEAREASFGRLDALDRASLCGAFESNRRRH